MIMLCFKRSLIAVIEYAGDMRAEASEDQLRDNHRSFKARDHRPCTMMVMIER